MDTAEGFKGITFQKLWMLVFLQNCPEGQRGRGVQGEKRGLGHLGEKEENPPDPSWIPTKENLLSTQALQITGFIHALK